MTNTPGEVVIHLNDLLGQAVGVENIGSGSVDATENWWGCAGGPGSGECSRVQGARVTFTPSLRMPEAPEPDESSEATSNQNAQH